MKSFELSLVILLGVAAIEVAFAKQRIRYNRDEHEVPELPILDDCSKSEATPRTQSFKSDS